MEARDTTTFLPIEESSLEGRWFRSGTDSAPEIVMLHEGLGSLSTWKDFPQTLAEACHANVYAYSRAGHGLSSECAIPRPTNALQREATEVLPKVLEQIEFKGGILLGHSDGASIATIYAGRHRDRRIRGLVLIEPHFNIEQKNLASIEALSKTYAQSGLLSRLARHHRNAFHTFDAWRTMWLNPAFTIDLTAELKSIEAPILIVKSADDPYSTSLQLELAQNNCRCPVENLIISGDNHAPHRANPPLVLERIRQFVQACLEGRE